MLSPDDVVAAVEAEAAEIEGLLAHLVTAPTVLGQEEAGQLVMEGALRDAGLEPFSVPLDAEAIRTHPDHSPFSWSVEGKRNVLARWGSGEGRSLILNGHVDVVPPGPTDLWRTPAFSATRDGDWLAGRGACDMKSGLAAIVGAVRALRHLGLEPAGRVTIQSVVEEECTGNGTLQCVISGHGQADGAVLVEPMGDAVCVAQSGILWFDVRVHGSGGHTADLGGALSAIEVADRVRVALRDLEERLREPGHPAFASIARPTAMNVGAVTAGEIASIVPVDCRLRARIGLLPGTDIPALRREIERVCGVVAADLGLRGPDVTYEGFAAHAYVLPPDAAILEAALGVLGRRLDREAATSAVGGCSDARTLGTAGTPSILFGASGDGWHAPNERVRVSSVLETAVRLVLIAEEWCGLRRR